MNFCSRASVMPNPLLKLTRYGRHCKPDLRYFLQCHSPGLQYLPPRAAQFELQGHPPQKSNTGPPGLNCEAIDPGSTRLHLERLAG